MRPEGEQGGVYLALGWCDKSGRISIGWGPNRRTAPVQRCRIAYDLIVIGIGLAGRVIARDAVRHGASVALIDQSDIAFRAARGNFRLVGERTLTRSGRRRSGLSGGDRVSERLPDAPPEFRNSERACRFQGEAWLPA